MPEVSIILPVYNEERHLQKTLSTLCTQTFRDFELLAVDDGSTDESRRILERFAAADARITVLAQHHGGVSRARNLALESRHRKVGVVCRQRRPAVFELPRKSIA